MKTVTRVTNVNNVLQTRLKPAVMFVGDSIVNNAYSTTYNGTNNHGFAFWAKVASQGRIRTPNALNFGVGGDTTALVLARIAAIKSASADVAVLHVGTNDIGGSVNPEVLRANYRKIVDAIQESGKVVCCLAPLPREGITTEKAVALVSFREWVLAEMPKMGCIVADAWGALFDRSRGVAGIRQGLTLDNLHPNPAGAKLVGDIVWDALSPLFELSQAKSKFPIEYDGTTNPYGSINTNPRMAGTAGTINTSCNATVGSVMATGYTASGTAYTNATSTFTKVVEDGVEKQVIQIGGVPATGAQIILSQTLTLARFVSGKTYKVTANVEVGDGARALSGVSIELRVIDTATIYRRDGNQYSETIGLNNDGFSGVLESDTYLATGTKTEVRARVVIFPTIGVVPTGVKVKIWNFDVVEVV